MILDPTTVIALALRCAPAVAPETLLAVARAESRLNPLAIGVNGGPAPAPPHSADEAITTAARLLARGANLDLGLAQINSANLARLGLSVAEAFDPCRNLAAAATVLSADYAHTRSRDTEDQSALRKALSLYNTGDAARGLRNGYVARVEAAAQTSDAPPSPPMRASQPWDVFGAPSAEVFVIVPPSTSEGTDR